MNWDFKSVLKTTEIHEAKHIGQKCFDTRGVYAGVTAKNYKKKNCEDNLKSIKSRNE